MFKIRTRPFSLSSVFRCRSISLKRFFIALLALALVLNVWVSGARGQSAIPTRGVEEGGRVYIGEPLSSYVGHMAMLLVTGKHTTMGNGTQQDTVNWVNDPLHSCVADGTGGLAVYAHPEDASRVLLLNGLTGMEVFHKTELPGASPYFRDKMWDTVLTTLYAQGKPLIWGFASDDTHFTSTGNFNHAWNASLVPSLDLFALKNALRTGAFYTSNGPALSGISVSGTTITLNLGQSSEVLWLRAGQYHNGTSFTQSPVLGAGKAVKIEQGVTTSSLDIASLGIPLSDLHFVRAIVRTANNTYALTQPFKISATGVISNPYPTTGTWVKGQSHNHDDAWIDNTGGITTFRSNYESVGQLASFETAYSYWETPFQRLDSDGFPDLTSVSPAKINWGLSPEITINGVNFADGAAVQLGPHALINVVRESATVLRATVPVDVPPGIYDLVVTNPDNYRGTLALGLTVQDSTADNTRWTSYGAPDLPWDQTTSVMATGNEVWVGTMKGAAQFKNGVWSKFIPSGGLNIFSRGIYGIAADPGGGMWFSSVGMWFRNSAGTFPWQWQSVKSSTSERWGKMAFDSAGTLWVTSRWGEGIAKRSASGTWSVTTAGLPSTDNQAITRDSLGNMWVGFSGGQGIWKWNGSTWQNVPVPGGAAGLAQATYASALVTAPNGDVWAAVHPMNLAYAPEKSGVVRFKTDGSTAVYKAPQLPQPRVTDILVTSTGDVWFSSRAGVSRLSATGQWQTFTTQNSGLGSDIVMDMAEDQAGNIWFATANGVSSFSPFDFSLSNSGDVSAAQGSSGMTDIDVTLLSNPTRAVTFSVSGLPSGASASFSQPSCSPNCTASMTVSASGSTVPGSYMLTVTGTSGSLARSTNFHLIVNSGGNQPPVAVAESYSTNEDTALTVAVPGVLGNDTDAEGNPLTAILVSGPTHGTLTLNTNGSFSYTPSAGYSGPDSFTYKANDGTVDSNVATVTITVTAINNSPVAVDDSYSTNEDTALTVAVPGVLGNDTDADGNPLTTILVSGPTHGTLTLDTNGSFGYTPTANYSGPDSFTYRANDGTVDSNVVTVSITVTAVNDAAVAVNDSYSTNEDTALTVAVPGVLGNDTDADGNPLTAIQVSGPTHGTLTLNANGSFSYTPSAGYGGPDSFTYKANDGTVDSNVATVTITVTAINNSPVAVDDSYSTNEDTALTVAVPGVLGNDTDADGNPLTAIQVSGPTHGALTLNANGSFSYTPTANYSGPDSFTYKANDGTVDSNVVTVSITVTAVNDAAVAVNDSYSTNEDTALTVAVPGVLGNDTDADGNPLTAIQVSGPTHGTLTLNANGSFSYTPSAGYSGPDSFTYKANDGTVDSNVAAVAITIGAVNDAPVAVNDSYSTNEDTALTVILPGVLGNDTDADGNPLTAIQVSGPTHGALTLNANGSFSYTPTANYSGPDSFTYKANDGTVDSNVVTVSITVTAVNDAAVAVNDSYSTNEDTALTVAVPGVLGNDTDADGNPLTAIQVSGPTHGTLTLNANGSFSYTPTAGYSGPDSFTYKANDGTVDSNVAAVAITIGAVNDAPVAVADSYGTNEDTALTVIVPGVLGNDTDADGNPLTAIQVSGPTHGALTLNANGSFSYTPTANYSGPDSFTYKANDGTVDSNVVTVSITVTAVNDAPVAVNDSYSTNEDTALTVAVPGVLGNDTDADGNPLTAIQVSGPTHGTLTLNANGSFSYTPTAGYSGPDSFTYKANDGTVDSNVAAVAITIGAVNDAPVAVNDSYSTNEDTALTVAVPGVLGNDTDADGNPLTAIQVSGPTHGTLTLNANGSFSFTPTANYSGPDSFTYKANDGTVDSNVVTVSITVTAVNDAPVAVADAYSTNEDTALTVAVPGVLGNDTDADGNPLTAIQLSGPTHGTLTLNANGSFSYTPTAGYSGPDSFTYKANDATVDSNVATVTITVTAVNDAPVAVADTYTTNEDTAFTVILPGVLGNDTDVDGNPLTAILVSGPAHGTLTLNANGSFSYTPTANYSGPDSFTYRANDGTAVSNIVTVTITVNAINDPPVVTNPSNQSNSEGDTVNRPIQASDPEGDQLTYSATGLPIGLSIDAGTGIISGDVSFGAAAGSPYAVQITINDGNAVNSTTTINFTWSIVNGILFRAASFSQNNGSATTLVISKPAGITAGNVMLASINVRGNPTITAPAGWTLISSVPNGTTIKQAIYFRVANASEGNTYTWTFSGGQAASGGIAVYGGVDRVNPVDVASGLANASSSSITAPSVSTTVANSRLVSIFGTATNAAINPPPGTTERGESAVSSGSNKIATEVADATRAAIGPTGTRVAAGDKSALNVGHQVALRPLAPPASAPPDAPSNLTAVPGNQQVSLSWSSSPGAASYNVKRLNTGTGFFETIQSGVLSTSYSNTGLLNGTTYTYVVTAVNSIAESGNSNEATATPCSVTASPGGLLATPGNAQVLLSWSATSGASTYNIKRSTTSGGPYSTIGTSGSTTYPDATVTNGTAYYYVVSAINSCGESSNSSQATATPQGPSVPTGPSNLTATAQSSTQFRLTWTDNSNNEDGFKIERCAGQNCTNFVQITIPPLAANTTSYTNTGLSANTWYRYRVRAYNSVGDSSYSNTTQSKTRPN